MQVDVCDVEQLVVTGKQMKACPYYGTRYAIPSAQVIPCSCFWEEFCIGNWLLPNCWCICHLL